MLDALHEDNWINLYIIWEISLIKELGFEFNLMRDMKFLNTILVVHNDIYSNMLLNLQLNPKKNYKIMPTQKKNNLYGFVYLFAKENIFFKSAIKRNLWLMDLPIENELVKKGSPLCTIFCSASSRAGLIRKLKEKISMTTNLIHASRIDFSTYRSP